MFGGKNKENLAKIENLSRELAHKEEVYQAVEASGRLFDANMQEYDSSVSQMYADVGQFQSNLDNCRALLSENGLRLNSLSEELQAFAQSSEEWRQAHEVFLQDVDRTFQNSLHAVDNNKHFTGPSKALSEFMEGARRDFAENKKILEQMGSCSQQMGVLALNAAIEAGRLGENGQQFVKSAEDIRDYVTNYEALIGNLSERFETEKKKTDALEEDVRRLIALLKDNNVAVSRLMKELGELRNSGIARMSEYPLDSVDAFLLATNQILDAEIEVGKMEERNRMQLDDIVGETGLQKKNIDEIRDAFEPVVRMTNMTK